METNSFFAPYVEYWKRYFDFEGKTTCRNYWMVVLVNLLISAVGGILITTPFVAYFAYVADSIYGVLTIIPSIAIAIRRLHDIGKSGLWLLLVFIPIVGAIILIVWFCQPSAEPQPTVEVVNSNETNPNAKPADAETIDADKK